MPAAYEPYRIEDFRKCRTGSVEAVEQRLELVGHLLVPGAIVHKPQMARDRVVRVHAAQLGALPVPVVLINHHGLSGVISIHLKVHNAPMREPFHRGTRSGMVTR